MITSIPTISSPRYDWSNGVLPTVNIPNVELPLSFTERLFGPDPIFRDMGRHGVLEQPEPWGTTELDQLQRMFDLFDHLAPIRGDNAEICQRQASLPCPLRITLTVS